jgi:hypothetical protein
VALVWESDHETVLTQVRFASFGGLDQGPPEPLSSEQVSAENFGFCCPYVGRGPGGFATLFRGAVEGELALFFKGFGDR